MSDKNSPRILGVATPFQQGGSVRMTLPKRLVKRFKIDEKMRHEFFGFIFLETGEGVLLVPLDKAINPGTVRDALSFANISNLSDEDLKILFEDQE